MDHVKPGRAGAVAYCTAVWYVARAEPEMINRGRIMYRTTGGAQNREWRCLLAAYENLVQTHPAVGTDSDAPVERSY